MSQVVRRYPKFSISFFTEDNEYHITYDAGGVTSDFLEESVISIITKNAMDDDSSTFSLVLAGDVYWDRVLTANDAVVLRVTPTEEGDQPDNTVLLVGMISEVRLEGDYGENSKMYRISGQSFAKAFINFEIGVIQEVSAVLTDLGWLPDDSNSGGVDFTMKTASQIGESVLERFVPYMKYNYASLQGSIDKFLTWELDSWVEEERLADPTPFINYEGTLKQFLDDIAAKPFNELFFEATKDEKCQMIMRRTPFDQADWENLPSFHVTSREVITESVSINDQEAFTIFNIPNPNNLLGASGLELGALPQYFPELFKKFGYKKLEVENRYLDTATINDSSEDAEEADTSVTDEESESDDTSSSRARTARTDSSGSKTFTDCYRLSMAFLDGKSRDRVRVNREKIATSISKVDKRLTKEVADSIIDAYISNGQVSKDEFSKLSGISTGSAPLGSRKPSYKAINEFMEQNQTNAVTTLKNLLANEFDISVDQANGLASAFVKNRFNMSTIEYNEIMDTRSEEALESVGTTSRYLVEFKKRLANWYCENPNFYSGDIVVKGSPEYRIGCKLYVTDEQNNEIWEYYIESVQNDYSYTQGYTTTLGVTRGLQNIGNERFKNLWGTSEDFKGGLMGELSLEELVAAQAKYDEEHNKGNNVGNGNGSGGGASGGGSNIPGGSIATKAVNFGRSRSRDESDHESYYLWGGGHGADPFTAQPYGMDCSAFVWWCFHKAGYDIGGSSPGTTWTMLADTNLETISTQGSKDPNLMDKMKVGDIIWFYSSNGHIGIYIGGGKWIGCNGFPPEDHSPSAGIKIEDLPGYWWENFNGNVKRVN